MHPRDTAAIAAQEAELIPTPSHQRSGRSDEGGSINFSALAEPSDRTRIGPSGGRWSVSFELGPVLLEHVVRGKHCPTTRRAWQALAQDCVRGGASAPPRATARRKSLGTRCQRGRSGCDQVRYGTRSARGVRWSLLAQTEGIPRPPQVGVGHQRSEMARHGATAQMIEVRVRRFRRDPASRLLKTRAMQRLR